MSETNTKSELTASQVVQRVRGCGTIEAVSIINASGADHTEIVGAYGNGAAAVEAVLNAAADARADREALADIESKLDRSRTST